MTRPKEVIRNVREGINMIYLGLGLCAIIIASWALSVQARKNDLTIEEINRDIDIMNGKFDNLTN